MRRFMVLCLLPLGGCVSVPKEAVIPVHGETAGHECNASAVSGQAGQLATTRLGRELVEQSRAAVLRWAPMGSMLTMDYRSDRLTVRLSADNHILALNCG